MEHFFRIKENVRVKSIEEIQNTVGRTNIGFWTNEGTVYMMAYYKHDTYVVFKEDMFNLVGKQGKVISGVYGKYLQIEIDNNVYNLPHFALELYDEINDIVDLEENTYYDIKS